MCVHFVAGVENANSAACVAGYDLIEWLMERLGVEESGKAGGGACGVRVKQVRGCFRGAQPGQPAVPVRLLLSGERLEDAGGEGRQFALQVSGAAVFGRAARFALLVFVGSQSPYYWPWQNRPPGNVEYAIYLAKRTLRNKQRHGLEEYELETLGNLRKNLANKWDFITMQAEEQVSAFRR